MIEEGIAAVDEARDSTFRDVAYYAGVLLEIKGPIFPRNARERGNSKNTFQRIKGHPITILRQNHPGGKHAPWVSIRRRDICLAAPQSTRSLTQVSPVREIVR